MTLSPTVENYLKHLFTEQQDSDAELLPMGKLAAALAVTPGTATTMVKTLADAGLVTYEPRGGVRLTARGEQHALNVIRRHRVVELFLVKVLGLDWSEVHAEAEKLEHAISEKVLEKLDELLGRPDCDPHGDPIPRATGKLAVMQFKSLMECELGLPQRIMRVLGQDTGFLQTLHRLELVPGAKVTVQTRAEFTDSVNVKTAGGKTTALGASAAAKILVQPA
ncbi:MAG: Iron-dependent repressor IdeR [Verrucomicrobiae bacterium]|nr:Iron-dependent repressor IdeR [Verrucomicrobiae bacterium]